MMDNLSLQQQTTVRYHIRGMGSQGSLRNDVSAAPDVSEAVLLQRSNQRRTRKNTRSNIDVSDIQVENSEL